jgi:hypothetical protein
VVGSSQKARTAAAAVCVLSRNSALPPDGGLDQWCPQPPEFLLLRAFEVERTSLRERLRVSLASRWIELAIDEEFIEVARSSGIL